MYRHPVRILFSGVMTTALFVTVPVGAIEILPARDSDPVITLLRDEVRTFSPGVYEDIFISGGAVVEFQPGIYIFAPTKPQQGLRINGDPTVTGLEVMFYFTGTNYLDGGDDGEAGVAGVDEDGRPTR